MNMDLGTLIIGAILVILCLSPFVIIALNSNGTEKKLVKLLEAMAYKKGSTINKHEVFSNFAIGIDPNNQYLFYVKNYKGHIMEKTVLLEDFNDCSIIQTDHTIKQAKKRQTIIDKLELHLQPANKAVSDYSIEFYNTDESLPLNGQLQAMQKWRHIIKSKQLKAA
ncbi:hypothetical protein D1013_13255 [Euzebyella marina]|uniref:Uncharacterized protein n=1 Tax=Euzebyella marina TaxID=1761453 RepID=A0A3G2L7R0_9FLAO|nr:hypothetical protein [Euzebyella marina]AYN68275.1 hypothetical protein D1013_13255 [Euzebyella marina]